MLRPLHSEFPLLWVIFFPPFGQLFFPLKGVSPKPFLQKASKT